MPLADDIRHDDECWADVTGVKSGSPPTEGLVPSMD